MKFRNRNSKITSHKRISVAIIVALITFVGVLSAAIINFLGTKYQTDTPIKATQVAEATATQLAGEIDAGVDHISIVLPGAHESPSSGGVYPDSDVYRENFEKLATRIQIPAINVDASIVQGDGWEELKKGVGQKLGTSYPGDNGLIVLSAYNDIFGEIFRYLEQLQEGDEIIIHTRTSQYSYFVKKHKIVPSPNLVLSIDPNVSELLLTSQHPYLQDDSWIVVYAYLGD